MERSGCEVKKTLKQEIEFELWGKHLTQETVDNQRFVIKNMEQDNYDQKEIKEALSYLDQMDERLRENIYIEVIKGRHLVQYKDLNFGKKLF